MPEKIARGRQIVTALTGNANFPSPQPTLAVITTAIDELEAANQAAQAARQEARTRTSEQNDKEEEFDQSFKRAKLLNSFNRSANRRAFMRGACSYLSFVALGYLQH
ncbi:MAG TPA: hypothetical protein VKB86_22560 [Pyrinomonadaceae bacterium]|nr:hypothetical protein [Pyrinomonadaceae bacterium]